MHAGPGAAAADADRAGGIAEFGRVGLAGPQNAANLVDSVLVALEDCLDGIQDVVELVLAEHLDQAAAPTRPCAGLSASARCSINRVLAPTSGASA